MVREVKMRMIGVVWELMQMCKWSEVRSSGMGEKKYFKVLDIITERMKSKKFVKKVYVSETVGPSCRERLLGR